MASGSEPEHLLEHPGIEGMIPEHLAMESELRWQVRSQEICSQESSSSDKENLALESIGGSSQEGGGSSQEGSGSDSDKEGRLAILQKKRKAEKLPEIAEEADDEEEYRKAKVWKEWWDSNKTDPEEINWDEIWDEVINKPMSKKEVAEWCASLPSPPANLEKIEGLDPDFKRPFVHDVDPELWEKYLQEVKESDGFDVTIDPGKTPYRLVWRIKHDAVPEIHQQLIDLAKRALQDEYPGYQFLEIERVTGYPCAGWVYNVTFRAQGADAPDGKSFQARIFIGIGKENVLFCRPKVVKT